MDDDAPLPSIALDTRTAPPADGFRAWAACMPEYKIAHEGPIEDFSATVHATLVGALAVTSGRVTPVRFARTRALASADGADGVNIMLLLEGALSGEVAERPLTAGPGSIVVIDLAHPFLVKTTGVSFVILSVPRAALAEHGGTAPELYGQARNAAAARLLGDTILALQRSLPGMTRADAPAVVRATAAMIVSCLARPRAPGPAPALRGLQFAARRLIDAKLDEDLAPAAICRVMRCSRSVLYRAFAPLGGVAVYVRDRRLDAAYVALSGDRTTRVAEIARRFRFSDPTAFTKAFSRRFGQSPSQTRDGEFGGPPIGFDGPSLFFRWARTLDATANRSPLGARDRVQVYGGDPVC